MSIKTKRLKESEARYTALIQDLLNNPKNENLPNEVIEPQIEAAFNEFLEALFQNEDECAEFISSGGIIDEIELLPLVFEHFKSIKIYEAIKANCEIAFSNVHFTESDELKKKRKELLEYMRKILGI